MNKDVYLLIANYTSKGTVIPLYPNRIDHDNFVRKGEAVTYPPPGANHLPFVVKNFPENNQDTEALIIIALPKNSVTLDYAWENVFPPGIEMEYADYFSPLSSLPVDWIAENIIVYTVNKHQ